MDKRASPVGGISLQSGEISVGQKNTSCTLQFLAAVLYTKYINYCITSIFRV